LDVPNSTTPIQASMHKLKIFDFPEIFHFRTALYVDLDCLFLGSLTFLFKKPIEDNKLYVFAERDSVENNNLISFSLSKEDNKDICYYTEEHMKTLRKHNKLPFNAGLFMFRCTRIMKQHFHKLNDFVKNFKGAYFYEQSFMNTYFHLNNVSDFSLFDRKNIFMLHNHKLSDVTPEHRIIHFNQIAGDGKGKVDAMSEYFSKFKQSHPAGFAQFDTRDEMIDQLIPSGGTIVEIGVFQGDFAEVLVKTKPKHLYLVDCWEATAICSGDVDGNNMKHFSSGEGLWKSVNARYEFYPNVSIHRQYSSEFLKSLENLSIDVIYIDGDHSYKGVKEDLNNAFPKIKKGGWIMGHDYEMNLKKAQFVYEFGVKQAVDEFCVEKGLKLFAKGMDGCVSYAIFVDFDALDSKVERMSPVESILNTKMPLPILFDTILSKGFTMVSKERLTGLYTKCNTFKNTNYSFVECGVARGGCLALMKYAAGPNNEIIGFDSFDGMPDITEKDIGEYNKSNPLSGFGKVGDNLSGGIENVYKTFRELQIDMTNVRLIKGYFNDTLNVKENIDSIDKIAVLRLDGDWYESTKICLDKFYSKVIPGGIVIIDDYGHWVGAKNATDEFRQEHNINSPLIKTDYTEHYWIKNV
jgi:hypothetical protein